MAEIKIIKEDTYNRKWQKEHPEKVAQFQKKYYEKNREQILQHQQEKITCECGKVINRGSTISHKRSFRHLYYIK